MSSFNQEKSEDLLKMKREKFRFEIRKSTNDFIFASKRFQAHVTEPLIIDSQNLNSSKNEIFEEKQSESNEIELKIKDLAYQLFLLVREKTISNINLIEILKKLREFSCLKGGTNIETIYKTGIIPDLISILGLYSNEENLIQNEGSIIQYEVLWLIANLAFKSEEIVENLIQNNVLEFLKIIIINIRKENFNNLDQVFLCCANISGELIYRDLLIEAQFDQILINFLQVHKADLNLAIYKNIAFLMSNLTRKNEKYSNRIICFLDFASQFLYFDDESLINEGLWILFYFTEFGAEYLDRINNLSIINKILKNTLLPNDQIKWVCIKIIGAFAYSSKYSEVLYKNNVFLYLSNMIDNWKVKIRKETIWVVSNLTAEDKEQELFNFIESDLYQKIIRLVIVDEFIVIKEGIYVLTNFINSSRNFPYLIDKFVNSNGFEVLLEKLDKYKNENHEFIERIIDSIETILYNGILNKKDYYTMFYKNNGIANVKIIIHNSEEKLSKKAEELYNNLIKYYK